MFKFIKGFFSTFIEMIMWFGALNSTYTETSLHSWNETNLIMHELLNVLVNLACKYFTEDTHICVYLGNWGPSFKTSLFTHGLSIAETFFYKYK